MNNCLTVRLRGAMSPAVLQRMRDLLGLEASGSLTNADDVEFGHGYLDDSHSICLRLAREQDDVWVLDLSHLQEPPPAQVVEQCLADIRAAASELDLILEAEAEGTHDTGVVRMATPDTDDGPQVAKVPAPPPGVGPVSPDQAEAIAIEWINAGRSPSERVRAGVYDFDLGYIVYPRSPSRAGSRRLSSRVGTARGVIDKKTGELTVWPSLPLEKVADMYREQVRTTE